MSTKLQDRPTTRIQRPVLREGQVRCPRCQGRLLFDHGDLTCVACGYEYMPEPRELVLYFSRRPTVRVAGVAIAVAGLSVGVTAGAGLGETAVVFALAAGVILLVAAGARAHSRRRAHGR